jgi:eukaryotic-like serine/threonine-protein kinase
MTAPTSFTAALADRYAVERELGQGGMATVYLARDLRHDRQVALKVLRPELAHALGPERFLREIRTTAQLAHPHILPLLDSGDAAGTLFYVMPFVDGESLRDRLTREKQLPLDEALQLTREVADALSYAHAHGVVHRDIKPENILLQSAHAVMADFGIARAIAAAGSARLTETGLAIGTPAYMSPEQAAGSQDVDGRSDQYSLGCVLYEMLSGETPYTGPTPQAILAKKLSEPLPRISVVRETVPPGVEAALHKALARTAADRFATASQFARALATAEAQGTSGTDAQTHGRTDARRRSAARWLVAVLVVVAMGAGVWITGALRSRRGPGGAAEPLHAVAVLPFTYRGDTAQAWLADGFTEAVIDGLARVEGLGVPASGRVSSYRGLDVREAGRALGVPRVVTGSVEVLGSQVRVRAQLVNVADGSVVWSLTPSNGGVEDVFAMQGSITAGIVADLVPRLAASTGAALGRRARPRDMQAYELYVKARQSTYTLTPAGIQRAVTLLEQALARDSTFADAWIALADAYSFFEGISDLPAADVASRYRHAVERGIQLDSLSGFAFSLRGYLRMQYDWDWDGAWSDMRRAVRLSPASADARVNYSILLINVGEPDSALAQMRVAVALDPTNPFMFLHLAMCFLAAGMLDSAQAASESTVVMDSTLVGPHLMLARVFALSGRRDDAEREATRGLRGVGDTPWLLAVTATQYKLVGRPDLAREALRRFNGLARRQPVSAGGLALARLAAGDRTGALDALEVAVRDHDLNSVFLLTGGLEELDGDPRYEAARKRVFGDINAPRPLVKLCRAPQHSGSVTVVPAGEPCGAPARSTRTSTP